MPTPPPPPEAAPQPPPLYSPPPQPQVQQQQQQAPQPQQPVPQQQVPQPQQPVPLPPMAQQQVPQSQQPVPQQQVPQSQQAGTTRPGMFAPRDPSARAQRIARALVSDIVAYHPARQQECLAAGTLRTEFREEIMKSWEEYVAQVGLETAKSTPYFRNALNEILARGAQIF
jgi:hypothetical protein